MNFVILVCVVVLLSCSSGNAEECKLSAAPPDPKSGCCGRPVGVDKSKCNAEECQLSAAPPEPKSGCCGRPVEVDKSIPGFYAQLSEYPWMGIILEHQEDKLKLACSAVLISGRYMLSAALCFGDHAIKSGSPITVRLGEYNTSNDGPDCVEVGGIQKCNDGALKIPIEKVIKHPDYNSKQSYQHDIALIRLAQVVPKTDYIQPICLPTSDVTLSPLNQRMWTAGWGVINNASAGFSERLHHVDLPYVDVETCQSAFNISKTPQTKLGSGQLCAGGEEGKDSCKGDAGGPLMYVRDHTTELAGIVSFGSNPCGKAGVPGVYTKVFAYDAWIRANIEP